MENMIVPEKLKAGDEVRIVAPSRSAAILSDEGVQQAKAQLESLGLRVTFGQHLFERDMHDSTSISNRVADLHAAFEDKHVKGILTVIGGFNSNELLPYLDYRLIRKNPKIFCGFSDITAIANAITAKCGFLTYSGPHFSSFDMEKGQAYQTAYFKACLMQDQPYHIESSLQWSDDAWFLDQENRTFYPTEWKIYNEGNTVGRVWGGNLCTLNLLQGTPYMPDLKDAILFIEDDEMTDPQTFSRDLSSLLQSVSSISGLILGRFQLASKITEEHLLFILQKHPALRDIPVMYDVDFGHTQPIITFPNGGKAAINTAEQEIKVLDF